MDIHNLFCVFSKLFRRTYGKNKIINEKTRRLYRIDITYIIILVFRMEFFYFFTVININFQAKKRDIVILICNGNVFNRVGYEHSTTQIYHSTIVKVPVITAVVIKLR